LILSSDVLGLVRVSEVILKVVGLLDKSIPCFKGDLLYLFLIFHGESSNLEPLFNFFLLSFEEGNGVQWAEVVV
jgi:hypothetical protein